MSITIDAAGRLVVPKAIRDAAGLQPGMALDIRLRGGRIEIEPQPVEIRIVVRDGVAVAVGPPGLAPLRTETVRETQESDRNGRA